MLFKPTPLAGACVVELEQRTDDRGFFARAFCAREMEEHGLEPRVAQANLSFNKEKGTLRGLHFQIPPHREDKLIRCIQGAVYDVIVDIREDSPTYRQWFGIELNAENRTALFIPKGFAHGYQTLTDSAEVLYLVSEFYAPGSGAGYRFDDPAFGIEWPLPPKNVSEQDLNWDRFGAGAQ